MSTYRILVFGSTGSGKTSLCNSLASAERPATASARGVTFESFVFPPFSTPEGSILLTDTVGLNESDKGSVKSADAVQQLIKLIKHSKDGYNLLIHVMRGPRITKDFTDNYEFFVKILTQSKIPCILVVTGCEATNPMSDWMDSNRAEFMNQGLTYSDLIAACFARGEGPVEVVYAPLREQSRDAVLNSIIKHASPTPILIYGNEEGFFSTVKRAWNWFCGWIGLPVLQFKVDEGVFAFLMRMKIPQAAARMLATGLG